MSTVSRVGQGGIGVGPGVIDAGPGPAGVAGITSVAIVIVSLIAMYGGPDAQRFLLTFSIASILYATLVYSPIIGIPMTMVYLCGFAMAKRYLIPILGYTTYDPLILVQPVVIGVFFMNLILRRRLPFDTPLSRMIGVLLLIMLAEMANPLQGGIAISLAGGMFYIVPMIWFYAGRLLSTPKIVHRLLMTLIAVSVISVFYGFWQQFVGFSDVEKKWIELTKNDNGQYITGGVMRVFSFFSSFAEYSSIATIAAVVCWAYFLRKNKFAIIPWGFLAAGVILSSSRGALLLLLFGCSLVWALQGKDPRSWVPRLVVSAILGIAALVTGLNQVKQVNTPNDTADALIQHQANGILNITDERKSTGTVHTNEIIVGVARGFTQPLGTGLGTTTIAGDKFGVQLGGSAEADYGNMFISCGAFGGLLYSAILVFTVWLAVRSWHRHRDILFISIIGLLLSSQSAWLIGARYAQCMITWFLIGYLDRVWLQDKIRERQAKALPASSVPAEITNGPKVASLSPSGEAAAQPKEV